MRHIILHNIDLEVNPLKVTNGIIPTFSSRDNMVKARIFPDNKFSASIGTSVILLLKEFFNV